MDEEGDGWMDRQMGGWTDGCVGWVSDWLN
jgi:hypothetical protein